MKGSLWEHGALLAFALFVTARSASAELTAAPPEETNEHPPRAGRDLLGTPREIPIAPKAQTLPDLTHPYAEMSAEHTIASVAPKAGTLGVPDHARLSAHLFHFDTDVPLTSYLYVGGAWAFAAARGATDDSVHVVPGQPEIYARVIRALEGESYEIGAGLAVLPPLAKYDDLAASERLARSSAASLVSVVRPWDVSMFLDRRVTAKPWIDLRTKNRRLVAQFRQAIDIGWRVSTTPCTAGTACDEADDLQIMSISTLYLGWLPTRELAIGIEAWEIYLLKTQLLVNDRAALALSPTIRFFFRWVEPSVSVLFPLGPTLLNAADGYYALRLEMRVWFGGR